MCISPCLAASQVAACVCVCTAPLHSTSHGWGGRVHATMMLSNLPWDVTAGLLMVREAGGSVYDFDGTPHDANSRYTLASGRALVEPITRVVREAM